MWIATFPLNKYPVITSTNKSKKSVPVSNFEENFYYQRSQPKFAFDHCWLWSTWVVVVGTVAVEAWEANPESTVPSDCERNDETLAVW